MLTHGWGSWSITKKSAYKCFHTIWKQSQFYVQWMQRHHTLHHFFYAFVVIKTMQNVGIEWIVNKQLMEVGHD